VTFAIEKKVVGKKTLETIEPTFDSCSLTYGVGACTATGAAGSECNNTRPTCHDVGNYAKTTTTYKTCSKSNMPMGEGLFPCLEKVSISPAIAEPGKIGVRATITATLSDFSHHDRGVDPYATTRSYDAMEQGTFWGRMIARNPYYPGRPLTYKKGYIANTFSWNDFESRSYVMDTISGPDQMGRVTIKGRDRLILAQDDKIQIPEASVGTLTAGITSVSSSFTMSTGDGASYDSAGTISLGDEDIIYTRVSDAFTLTTRGANGTTAEDHDQDDLVQQCKTHTLENVVDVLHEYLILIGIDESNIPYDAGLSVPTGTNDEWDDLKEIWIASNSLTRTVREPTGARNLIEEMLEQNNLMLWHDLVSDKIKLAANVPPLANATLSTYTDEKNFIGLPKVTRDEKRRVTSVWIYWGKIDNSAGDKPANYRYLHISADSNKSSADQYDGHQIRKIFASWLPDQALVSQLGGRMVARYANTPHVIDFKLDMRDSDLMIGDICWINTRQLQNFDGSNKVEQVQIISRNDDSDPLVYKGLTSTFSGKYGFIAPNTIGSRLTETEENVRKYGFICENTGFFADGEPGDKII